MSWLQCNARLDCSAYRWNCSETTDSSTCADISWTCKSNNNCNTTANSDISGKGVLVSFFVTAILTFICAWSMLLLDATFHGDDHKSLGVLDRRFIWAVGWWKKTDRLTPHEPDSTLGKWKLVLQKVLITFSDVHLLTGLAILIAGFSQACSITVYHYHAVVYLAWTSFSVHMVTLTISRFYLRKNMPILIIRLIFMSVLFVLLFIAVCLTASSKWPTSIDAAYTFDAPAVCTLKDGNLSKWRGDTIFALILLSLGFGCRLCKVFACTSDACQRWLRTIPEDTLRKLFNRFHEARADSTTAVARVFYYLWSWFVLAFYLYIRAFYDIYESLLIELIWMTLSLLWGFAQIFSWHQFSPLNQFESAWNFGQILPLLLVATPLLALPEFYSDSKTEARIEAKQNAEEVEELELQTMIQPRNERRLTFKMRRSFWTETTLTSPQPGKVKTDVPFLDKRNEAYRSLSYSILVTLHFLVGLTIFGIIIYPKFLTNGWYVQSRKNTFDTWTKFFRNTENWLYVWLPLLFGPTVLWFLFMAPLSKMIRRALKGKAGGLLSSPNIELVLHQL